MKKGTVSVDEENEEIWLMNEWLFCMIKEEEKPRCINENASQLKSLTEKVFAFGS